MKISTAQRAVVLMLVLSAAPPLVVAAESEEGALEEILITAQKREQRLNDVGIAVTAVSADQIQKLGLTGSTDVATHSPGVFISADLGGQNQRFTIRGVGQNDFLDALEAPVAIYVDEGYVSAQQGQAFGLFDMERIEVLRGPQGTLFGRNATGGLVHYITRKPTLTGNTESYGALTIGSYNQVIGEAASGASFSDSAAARVAVRYSRHDGVFNNDFQGGPRFSLDSAPGRRDDLQNDDSFSGRAHLLFSNGGGTELLLTVEGSRVRVGSGAYEQRAIIAEVDGLGRQINTFPAAANETRAMIGPGGADVPTLGVATRPLPGGDLFGYRDTNLGDFRGRLDWAYDSINHYDSGGVRARVTHDLADRLTLTSITDFKAYGKVASLDVDASPADLFYYFDRADTKTYAEELRLNGSSARADWVTGAYLLGIDNHTFTGLAFLGTSPLTFLPPPLGFHTNPLDPAPGPGLKFMDEVSLRTRSASVFGQVDYALTDQWKLILGARVIQEEKKYSFAQNAYVNVDPFDFKPRTGEFAFNVPQPSGSNPYHKNASNTLWAGKAQIDWHPSEGMLVYGGVNRGVKAGSFNSPLPDGSQVPPQNLSYKAEVLLAYEAGFKRSLQNGHTQLNGSLFFYDYRNYQAFTFTNVSGVINNEDATIKGAELELVTNPLRHLTLQIDASYTDPRVKDVEVAPGIFRDVQPTFTPKWLVSGLARYTWSIGAGELAVQLDGNFVDDRWANLRNFDAHLIDSYVVGNARLFWENPARTWQASVFVTNFANEKVVTERFDLARLCGCEDVHYGMPRWFGASVRYNFH